MAYTREQWARTFLGAVGNPAPPLWLVQWVAGWTTHEWQQSSESDCTCNLLNTHQAGWPKCHGDNYQVAAFPDMVTGATVNAAVLNSAHLGYKELKQALVSADKAALTTPSAGVSRGLYTWVHGDVNQAAPAYGGTVPNWINDGAAAMAESIPGIGGQMPNITCTSANAGSCKVCVGVTPGQCGTDEVCVIFHSDGTVTRAPFSPTPNGVCVTNKYATDHPAGSGPINPSPSGLPDWLVNPDWARLAKGLVGVILLLAGMALLVGILVGKVENTDTFKTAARVAKVAAA